MNQVAATSSNTRRWPRYQVDLPVRIIGLNGVLTNPIMGRGSDISRAGMALRASVALKPGDLMQLQFPTAEPSRVSAVVRYSNGTILGLEFLSQLPPDDETKEHLRTQADSILEVPDTLPARPLNPRTVFASLRKKKEELKQLKREIEILSIAALLLADGEVEIEHLTPPPGWETNARPWPTQA
ncbi:MAG TPA: PilZ domain-containing protein [Candidatus Sulfotelmatobacter sp.]|jgi:hypothetical protein